MSGPLLIPLDGLPGFCTAWGVSESGVFGSVLGPSFGPERDVDILMPLASRARTPTGSSAASSALAT